MKKLFRNFAILAAITSTVTMTSCQKELDEVAPVTKEQVSDSAERHPPIATIIK